MKIVTLALLSALSIATLASAQQSNNTTKQREFEQQERIGNGLRSGQLTAAETVRVEQQEHAINHEERDMRAANDGHLTRVDRATLQHQQNQQSRHIYRVKHNGHIR